MVCCFSSYAVELSVWCSSIHCVHFLGCPSKVPSAVLGLSVILGSFPVRHFVAVSFDWWWLNEKPNGFVCYQFYLADCIFLLLFLVYFPSANSHLNQFWCSEQWLDELNFFPFLAKWWLIMMSSLLSKSYDWLPLACCLQVAVVLCAVLQQTSDINRGQNQVLLVNAT